MITLPYEIPQELRYRERIVFGLACEQLIGVFKVSLIEKFKYKFTNLSNRILLG